MNSRHGKIARLPKPIREQINQRLDNGETAAALVKWLNTLPEVQKLLTEQFAGQPIRPQNLSRWRNGGYIDWLRHQQLREQTRWTTEQSSDLNSDTDANTISIAENVAIIMSAELAVHVQALLGIKNPKQRFRQFCRLSRELSRLRRDDQRACRTILRRQQWESTRQPANPEPESSEPPLDTPPPTLDTSEPQPSTLDASESSPDPGPLPLGTSEPQPETVEPPKPHLDTQPSPLAPPEPSTLAPSDPPLDPRPSTLDTSHPAPRPSPLDTSDVPNCHYPDYPLHIAPKRSEGGSNILQNPAKSHYKKYPMTPIRGRRFVCIEG